MDDVLDTYAQPCEPAQLVKDTREALAATTTHARRVDYEYERAGTAAVFMFSEPLGAGGPRAAHQSGLGASSSRSGGGALR